MPVQICMQVANTCELDEHQKQISSIFQRVYMLWTYYIIKRLLPVLWRVGRWTATPLQVCMCLPYTGVLDEHKKKTSHRFSSGFRPGRHRTALTDYLLGCGGCCSGQQCLCRSPCKFLIRVNWMNPRTKFHRFSSELRCCGHSTLLRD